MTIRKIVTTTERILNEGGCALSEPLVLCAAAAVISNPWLGRSVDDLSKEVQTIAPELALRLTQCIIEELGGAENVTAYGKGAIVGVDGEMEHGAAFLHTPYFGNIIRERLLSDQYIKFADTRAGAGARLTVPMSHTENPGLRTHFVSHSFSIADAPAPGELVIAVVASTGGRPFPRIGDRTTDPGVKLADFAEVAREIGIEL